jgi:hypothetical protein
MPTRLRPNRVRLAFLGVAAGSLAACGVPTDLADWDMTWSVPTTGTTISVNSMLPSGVTSSGNSFLVSVSPVSITRRLGDDCSACSAADGLTIPKPAFTGSGTATTSLPERVNSATLGTNQIAVTLRHGWGFDPLRPSATARGWLRIVATDMSSGQVIGRDSINGATTAFPSGTDLVRSMTLTGTVARRLTMPAIVMVTTTMDSPAGDNVRMQSASTFSASANFSTLAVSQAQVALTNQQVNAAATTLDLRDVGGAIRDRATAGVLQLTITNPFAVTGALTLRFTGGDQPVTKSITLSANTTTQAASTTTQDVPLSRDELRSLFGKSISLAVTGQVNGVSVNVTPGQSVNVSARMLLTLTREAP